MSFADFVVDIPTTLETEKEISSMTYLYTAIVPTRLYIKQCPHCALKYFGKSIRTDIEKYIGSGIKWKNHLTKYNVTPTHLWSSDWYYDTSISRFAIKFSRINKIVTSDKWANLTEENGLDGFSSEESKIIQNSRIANGIHHLQGSDLQKKLVENGRHNTQNQRIIEYNREIQKSLVENGVHIFQLIGRDHVSNAVENRTHIFLDHDFQHMMKLKTIERVENGTHTFLGGELQKKRIEEGTHHFITNHPNRQRWRCLVTGLISTKSGFTQRARKQGMKSWPHILEKI